MKVLQLIDTLEAGGAEKMSVQIANSLAHKIEGSALCATRKEGLLKTEINPNVNYLFANKKSTFDIFAIRRVLMYCKAQSIDIIHAHGSSFFLATLLKIFRPSLNIVWHDHHGNRAHMPRFAYNVLKRCSSYFDCAISVNEELLQWAKRHLKANSYKYLPNFVSSKTLEVEATHKMQGEDGKRIVCIANLRDPKNHELLIESFAKSKIFEKGWTLHLIGKDFNDSYSENIKGLMTSKGLANSVFTLGLKDNVHAYLKASEIGVMTSTKEGLPMAILEYGQAGLAVIATKVGQIPDVVKDNGLLCESKDLECFTYALVELTTKDLARKRLAADFKEHILQHYSEDSVIEKLLTIYKRID